MSDAATHHLSPVTGERAAIVVQDLTKTYGDGTKAVRGVSFAVRRGEFYGILGPNGAGKSTTIGVLGTLVRPTSGHASVLGIDVTKDPNAVRHRIGFALQEAGVDTLATGLEFLVLQGRLHGLAEREADRRARGLLKLFGLEAAAHRRIRDYSGGMKRRLDLAGALIHEPPVLFLDEPSEGLDPRSRAALWSLLKRINRAKRTTVILTTHYMEEADRLCDRLAIIDQGLIVAEGTPAALKAAVGGEAVVVHYGPEGAAKVPRAVDALRDAPGVLRTAAADGDLKVYARDAAAAAPEILKRLDQAGVPAPSLSIERPTLDDAYLRYTGRTIATAEAGAAARRAPKGAKR
ncbi:MAG: ATP-binding cassette domain-containing protein [Methanobacteriota archaeon]